MAELFYTVFIFFYAVILHEYAHGWMANQLGDPTAKRLGRLTFNPIKHVDPVGTVALPAMLFLMKAPIMFGWAKPVPVNFLNLRHPKRDMMWVGLAGPAVNIFLAVVFSQLLTLNLSEVWYRVFESAVVMNLALAIFNLMPIPPLDGSRLLMGILPNPFAMYYARLGSYGILVVLLLVYVGFVDKYVWPIVSFFARQLGVS